ncbi:hypothetical protein B5M09_000352 [Aphanomyces astaci]|uniref:Uncharacterized protein n=1 Tax=Aphanomyces astaci TaxID=112090 RepID=A0A425DFG7_APHAT|nr:hypothetical protein B5M09_000352 [Aphanomyces astaci]
MPQLPLNAPTGTIKMVLSLVTFISFYTPLVIAMYYINRHSPSIKYRNPNELAFVALSAFLNGLGRCLGPLFVDDISCTLRLLSLGIA